MVKQDIVDTTIQSSRKGDDPGLCAREVPVRRLRSQGGGASSRTAFTSTPHFTEDELVAMIDALQHVDQISEKTWSRLLVENLLQKFKWYFPAKDKPDAPSLSKAWTYYEYVTLPRHFFGGHNKGGKLVRSDPGETKETELYHLFKTSEENLIGWGTGVGLYFTSLRIMAIILFLAGLINIASICYYVGPNYSGPNSRGSLPFTLKGTAVCTREEWVNCPNCTRSKFPSDRFVQFNRIVNETLNETVTLALRNGCNGATLSHGLINWFTLLFMAISIALVSFYLKISEHRLGEKKSTAADYTVVVKNPPPESLDPDEWHMFFSQFADNQVTVVTIALNNHEMLEKLILRRSYRDILRRILPKGTNLDDEDNVRMAVDAYARERDAEPDGCLLSVLKATVLPILRLCGYFIRAETLVERIFTLTDEIRDLQKETYKASKIFVTFETEEGQRAALTALSTSKIDVFFNNTSNAAPSTVFKGRLLNVSQPTEPSAVRWLDLSSSLTSRVGFRLLNFTVTCGLLAVTGLIVARVRDAFGPGVSGPVIAIFNLIVPFIITLMMMFERHASEGDWQNSYYLKITLFRWFNTAILTDIITPFTASIRDGSTSIPTINAILWSELWLTPALQLLDITSNICKHILAPRAKNQEEMNLNFQGTAYDLGERYTHFTNILFVCFFYSALFPSTFFFGAAILIVQYIVDKYRLFRMFAWTPNVGPELAVFSRRYFFSTALFAFAVVSSYTWAQFPYDNLCEAEGDEPFRIGVYEARVFGSNDYKNFTVKSDESFKFCSQKWKHFKGFYFPAIPSKQRERWMTDSQERLTTLFGWTSVLALIAWVYIVSGGAITKFLLSFFRKSYKPTKADQMIDFSCVPEIAAYIPQIKLKGFPFPFLACDIDDFDQDLIGWTDPHHGYDYWNLMFDIPFKDMPRQRSSVIQADERSYERRKEGWRRPRSSRTRPIFSIIQDYPPDWKVNHQSSFKGY